MNPENEKIVMGLYDDYAQEVLVATRARHLILSVLEGDRGTSLSMKGLMDTDLALRLPRMLQAAARDLLAGAYDAPSPYDALLREIYRTTRAKACFMVVLEGKYGTHVSRAAEPEMLQTFLPSFLTFVATVSKGLDLALRQVSH